MEMVEKEIEIPLKVWQDPQGDVVLHYSRSNCFVYFGCWISAGEPADYICKLTFYNTSAVKCFKFEYTPYENREFKYHSKISIIENSQWLKRVSEQRLEYHPDGKMWKDKDRQHYVVSGHDNYYDIIASGFEEQIISQNDAGELKRLIDEA